MLFPLLHLKMESVTADTDAMRGAVCCRHLPQRSSLSPANLRRGHPNLRRAGADFRCGRRVFGAGKPAVASVSDVLLP